MGHEEHKARSPSVVHCMVVTISDSRTPETDEGGRLIQNLLRDQGHTVEDYQLIKDEPKRIKELILSAAARTGVQAVILTGGTGISKRDRTYDVLVQLLEKRLEGFGELFRSLSYQEIGASAMLSRATAGTVRGLVVFSIPGSPSAVRLAMEKLILPELGHIVREVGR